MMENLTEIMDMLDWNMPSEIQSNGISLARNLGSIVPFLQPVTPEHNKNAWDNCAVIIAEKNDEELKPHLVQLLEWLQDMNWPGAFCILDRLQKYADKEAIRSAINVCMEKAKQCGEEVWEDNLSLLLQNPESNSDA